MQLAAMPGLLVVLTLGLLCFLHLGTFMKNRSLLPLAGLEERFHGAGAKWAGQPVSHLRGRLKLDANRVVQRDGELYFLPDIEHVTGRSFLSGGGKNSHVVLKPNGGGTRSRHPLPAILDFDQRLRERGIRLVLLPTPSKAMFAGEGELPMRNEGFEGFVRELEKHDIAVFDLAPYFADYQERGNRLFLKGDSHWTPEVMRMSAVLLSVYLQKGGLLPGTPRENFPGSTRRITNTGDLAVLLDDGKRERWKETVQVHPVTGNSRPGRNFPLLLLGDSFSNVFSEETMGWGANAGFAEALTQVMGFPVDRVAVNDGGASGSRHALATSAGRLGETNVLVWQFAARELSFGDWRILPLPEAKNPPESPDRKVGGGVLSGTVAETARIPPLTRKPYRWAVMEIRLVEVAWEEERGERPGELVLLGPAVLDRRRTPMTEWKAGQRFRVSCVPWQETSEAVARWHRFALDDPDFELIDAPRMWLEMWGRENEPLKPLAIPSGSAPAQDD